VSMSENCIFDLRLCTSPSLFQPLLNSVKSSMHTEHTTTRMLLCNLYDLSCICKRAHA
jgi:hypothetical protein